MKNESKFLPDDPRLAAYALGELEPAERATVETLLAEDASARLRVEEIRAFCGQLEDALAHEDPVPATPDAAVVPHRGASMPQATPSQRRLPEYDAGGKVLRFPQMYFVIGGLAAACFAVVVAVRDDTPKPVVHRYEITFPKVAAADPSALVFAAEGGDGAEGTRPAGFIPVEKAPVSEVPILLGTRSYAAVRDALDAGTRVDPDEVSIPELLNRFGRLRIPAAATRERFRGDLEIAEAPWAPERRLARISVQATGAARQNAVSSAVVAERVRLKVRFNPSQVASYRLIGYDRGSGGPAATPGATLLSGQAVTALYEIVPVGTPAPEGAEPGLVAAPSYALQAEVEFAVPGDPELRSLAFSVSDAGSTFENASNEFKMAAAIAQFGLLLRNSPERVATLNDVLAWAGPRALAVKGDVEFVDLVRQAQLVYQ